MESRPGMSAGAKFVDITFRSSPSGVVVSLPHVATIVGEAPGSAAHRLRLQFDRPVQHGLLPGLMGRLSWVEDGPKYRDAFVLDDALIEDVTDFSFAHAITLVSNRTLSMTRAARYHPAPTFHLLNGSLVRMDETDPDRARAPDPDPDPGPSESWRDRPALF
jgi:hypothetical protein